MNKVSSAELCGQISPPHKKLPLVKPSPEMELSPEPFQVLVAGFAGSSGQVLGSLAPVTASTARERRCRATEGLSGTWLCNSHCYFLLSFLIGNSCHLFSSHPSAVLSHTQSPAPVPPFSSGWVPQGYCQELVDTRGSWVLRCCWQRYNIRSAQAGLSQQHFSGLRCFSLGAALTAAPWANSSGFFYSAK